MCVCVCSLLNLLAKVCVQFEPAMDSSEHALVRQQKREAFARSTNFVLSTLILNKIETKGILAKVARAQVTRAFANAKRK